MTNCTVRGTQRDRTYHQGNTIAYPVWGAHCSQANADTLRGTSGNCLSVTLSLTVGTHQSCSEDSRCEFVAIQLEPRGVLRFPESGYLWFNGEIKTFSLVNNFKNER